MLVGLVAHEDEEQAGGPVGLGFLQPASHVVERFLVGDVVADDGPDGIAIVAAGDGLEAFLPGLSQRKSTVSQICSLILLSATLMVLAPNSTPIVTSCLSRYRLSVYCSSRHDFPTPTSRLPYLSPR